MIPLREQPCPLEVFNFFQFDSQYRQVRGITLKHLRVHGLSGSRNERNGAAGYNRTQDRGDVSEVLCTGKTRPFA